MNRLYLSLVLLLLAGNVRTQEPVDHVNVLMGTMSTYELSSGNTYPVIGLPWGMNSWTPQTGKNGDGWQYQYSINKIRGIKQTHQPSPWMNDYGCFSLMPVTGAPVMDENKRASWFSHKAEVATPYFYSVYLADYDVTIELAPTERAAILRIHYPDYKESHLVIDAFNQQSEIIIESEMIRGFTTKNSGGVPENFRNYFVIYPDQPFEVTQNNDSLAIITFPKGSEVTLRVASSFISYEQAELNALEIAPDMTLETVAQGGRERWNEVLGLFRVEDRDIDHIRTFYSTLYRSLLFPRRFYEYDQEGKVWHYSPYNGEVRAGYMYTDTGFWDTFRSLFPLLNLVYPDENVRIQEGLVNAYLESGFLPEWASPGHRDIMVGNNSASVVADAYIKELRGYDAEKLWEAVVHGAHHVHPTVSATGRLGHEYYNTLGYIPYDVGINENAAHTLEYAYNDWCIYQFGRALGKPESEIEIYKERAYNYRNLFDREHNLMRGKLEDGTFQSPFNPLKWGDAFTEGNSWHYTWSVFHDPQGLIDLMGGRETFVSMLDSVFSVPPLFDESYYGIVIHEIREMQIMDMGNYAHGNQPIQHMIYLYNYAGEPWKAQYWVREVMDKLYAPTPDGYCGDEDNGQTSAWYVFSALGFYPVAPGSDQYVIGSPLFDKVTVLLPNGSELTLISEGSGRYIDEILVNGEAWSKTYFTHGQLLEGGTILYKMSETPNKTRGTQPSDAPYSFSLE